MVNWRDDIVSEDAMQKLRLDDNKHNPDVLDCLANLSSDEVFTSPKLANEMLDILPREIWKDPNIRLLDPCCKGGVFLREAAKRFLAGLKEIIPDDQERRDHVYHKQLFGIAITEITSLLARRTLYCTKYPNTKYSISHFDNPAGNILYKKRDHTWENGRCVYCGASQDNYDRSKNEAGSNESYAYDFIHLTKSEAEKMKFDVIIGNPPYQLSDGGHGASASPIYNKFVEMAKKLNPRYLCMIIPSRWFAGGKGLDRFRNEMLSDTSIRALVDYIDSKECFPDNDIKGGVCYFLRDGLYNGKALVITHNADSSVTTAERYLRTDGVDVFVRSSLMDDILQHVRLNNLPDNSMALITSVQKPYGFRTDVIGNEGKYGLPCMSEQPIDGGYRLVGLVKNKRTYRYVANNYPIPKIDLISYYKVFIPKAYGEGVFGETIPTPILARPGDMCAESFIQVGKFLSASEAESCLKYIKTKFFRAMVGIRKTTQDINQHKLELVPLQDFTNNSDVPWSKPIAEIDQYLYSKYGLNDEEKTYIETMVKEMA